MDREPAFPSDVWYHDGMTLRDYFAAKAMQGEAGESGLPMNSYQAGYAQMAERAYRMADAMLAEREKTGGEQ